MFDPTERAVRYRFGAQSLLERGSGVRPVNDGAVRDVDGDGNDDLVLRFPLDGTGFTTDGGTGILFWERDDSGEHGLAGSDTLTLTDEAYASDIDVLNYALSLEHLEYAFYRDAVALSDGAFNEWDVEGSSVGRYFDRSTLRFSVCQHLEDICDQEKAHAETLARTIDDLGGILLDATEYHFGDAYESVENLVSVAARLENIGVSAYAGAAPLLSNPDLLPPVLSITALRPDTPATSITSTLTVQYRMHSIQPNPSRQWPGSPSSSRTTDPNTSSPVRPRSSNPIQSRFLDILWRIPTDLDTS